jgi:hypothetical protein
MHKYIKVRNSKGSLVSWLLFLAIGGLSLVSGIIGLELLVRWVSLGRVQNAAKESAMGYARDLIRLRDNKLSELNAQSLTYQQAGIQGWRTPVVGSKANIPGANFGLEYLNASQILLYNVWGSRIKDASEVNDVRQRQCYKPHCDTRFSLNANSPLNECDVLGKVTSPIMSLTWTFESSPYGFGVCCPSPAGDNNSKDFCVKLTIKGRMDPIMAGGLPFLKDVDFIKDGDFDIVKRVVVKKMSAVEDTADSKNTAANLSGETIFIEDLPSNGTTCALEAPPPAPIVPVIAGQVSPPVVPPDTPDPVISLEESNLPLLPSPSCTAPSIECSAGLEAQIHSQSGCSVDYSCVPPNAPAQTQPGDSSQTTPPNNTSNNSQSSSSDKSSSSSSSGSTSNQASSSSTQCSQWGQNFQPSPDGKCPGYLDGGVGCGVSGYGYYDCRLGEDGCPNVCGDQRGRGCGPVGWCPCIRVKGVIVRVRLGRCNNTPISFVWDDAFSGQESWVAAKFPLNPESNSKWFKWKASAQRPLLVYDPKHTGKIVQAAQLFGNESFGIKWLNGFNALESLDNDKNKELSGTELKDLALWFDYDRNGVSEPGEVKSLSSLKVTKVFFKPTSSDLASKDIYAEHGYLRQIGEKQVFGSSVDWFSEELPQELSDNKTTLTNRKRKNI